MQLAPQILAGSMRRISNHRNSRPHCFLNPQSLARLHMACPVLHSTQAMVRGHPCRMLVVMVGHRPSSTGMAHGHRTYRDLVDQVPMVQPQWAECQWVVACRMVNRYLRTVRVPRRYNTRQRLISTIRSMEEVQALEEAVASATDRGKVRAPAWRWFWW